MSIRFERVGGIAIITIDRPEKLNALTLDMYDQLGDAFDRVRDDEAIGVAILTGAGSRAFCVGADLGESIPALSDERFDISRWDRAHQKHSTLNKPVIAAINGLCLGGGFEIMLSTALRVASTTAEFALPETGIGVVPAGGTLVRLTRQIPSAWAMELMLLGTRIDAATALRYGLLNRVVEPEDVMDVATGLAHSLLERSGSALAVVASAVRDLSEMPASAAFRAEALYGQRAFASADAREGLDAFAERRAPRFPSRGGETAP